MVVKADYSKWDVTINGKDFNKYPIKFRQEVISRLLQYCSEAELLNICRYIVTNEKSQNNFYVKEV